MSQYPGAYGEQQFGDPYGAPRKTSGMAITALVFSLIGIIPCCGWIAAPIGLLLGIIAFATIGPARKGRGMALAAIIISLILCVVWGCVGYWAKGKYDELMVAASKSPREALTAGFAGDYATFRSKFHGPGATASDAEVQAFIDSLRSRYGDFVNSNISGQQGQPQIGEPKIPWMYTFEFANQSMNGEVVTIIADEKTGQWIMKMESMSIHDPALGDLTYPPSGAPPPAATTPAAP